ncbi:MAG: FGGY family carbohydrate kinase, partial [Caldilinea sp.]
MSDRYILAHDLGTSGNKATLFDAQGHLVNSAFAPYDTAYPRPNWAEQNPQSWWEAVCSTSQKLLASSNVSANKIAAIGFSGMMMGCLPVAADGAALRSCIAERLTRPVASAWAKNVPMATSAMPASTSVSREDSSIGSPRA